MFRRLGLSAAFVVAGTCLSNAAVYMGKEMGSPLDEDKLSVLRERHGPVIDTVDWVSCASAVQEEPGGALVTPVLHPWQRHTIFVDDDRLFHNTLTSNARAGIIEHELAHLRNGDLAWYVLPLGCAAMAGAFVGISALAPRVPVAARALLAVAVGTCLENYDIKRVERRADKESSKRLTSDELRAMLRFLRALKRRAENKDPMELLRKGYLLDATGAYFNSTSVETQRLNPFQGHPPIDDRIKLFSDAHDTSLHPSPDLLGLPKPKA